MEITLLDAAVLTQRIYISSQILVWIASIIVLIVSIRCCRLKNTVAYAKDLPIYFSISILTEVLANIFPNPDVYLYIYWAFGLFEITYFLRFYRRILPSVRPTYFILANVTVIVISLVICLQTKSPTQPIFVTVVVGSFAVLVPVLQFFRRAITMRSSILLENDPVFWISTGVLFYFCVRIFIFCLSYYYVTKSDRELATTIYSVQNFALFISNILFIKGLICLKFVTR